MYLCVCVYVYGYGYAYGYVYGYVYVYLLTLYVFINKQYIYILTPLMGCQDSLRLEPKGTPHGTCCKVVCLRNDTP